MRFREDLSDERNRRMNSLRFDVGKSDLFYFFFFEEFREEMRVGVFFRD